MVRGGHTVSATTFAQMTGVSRERLRTWERRHGFPAPQRREGGPRRYRLRDVPRVVAVRRASDDGVPIADAIARLGESEPLAELSAHAFIALVEFAPLPVAVLAGPEPLALVHVNGALARQASVSGIPPDLAGLSRVVAEAPSGAQLRALFAGDQDEIVCEHPRWDGGRGDARSIGFRLPIEQGSAPLAALIGIEADRERALATEVAALRRELHLLRERDERHVRWIDAIGRLAGEFQIEAGAEARESALDTLVRQLNATDAALATYLSGQLAVASSRRGSVGPAMITLAAHPALAAALRDARAVWLEPAAALALGVPEGLHVCGVPIVVAGEALGLVLLLFGEWEEITPEVQRLLTAISAAVGFALLRDRLAQELREAAAGQS